MQNKKVITQRAIYIICTSSYCTDRIATAAAIFSNGWVIPARTEELGKRKAISGFQRGFDGYHIRLHFRKTLVHFPAEDPWVFLSVQTLIFPAGFT